MENKPTYEELQAQVEALRKALNDQLNDCINFDGGKLTDAIMKHSSDLLAATPQQQHLAEVKARASQAALEFCDRAFSEDEHHRFNLGDCVKEYTDSIQRGKK